MTTNDRNVKPTHIQIAAPKKLACSGMCSANTCSAKSKTATLEPAPRGEQNADTQSKLELRTPRYTSYPTADRFSDQFGAQDYERHLRDRESVAAGPLALYVHVPFCESLCYYCACNKTVTRQREKADRFLVAIQQELALVSEQLGRDRQVVELHLGGGTPTWLDNEELQRLVAILEHTFPFQSNADRSIEIDPRSVDEYTIECLADLDFNRMSIGVQDLDHRVQTAINRVQPLEMTKNVMERARATGFRSINLDLVYGLPYQTPSSFAKTVEQVIKLQPERIALFHYAHLPQVFKAQRRIPEASLPDAKTRNDIVESARENLETAGYLSIGLDHFALPHDELAIASRNGRLQRNFQGYCTRKGNDLIALGPSAISQVGNSYAQNFRGFEDWRKSVGEGQLATCRGIEQNRDDNIRRSIIHTLMCTGHLDFPSIDTSWLIDFKTYFAKELLKLKKMELEGLVSLGTETIDVTEKGRRLALRSIASVFDLYLQAAKSARLKPVNNIKSNASR